MVTSTPSSFQKVRCFSGNACALFRRHVRQRVAAGRRVRRVRRWEADRESWRSVRHPCSGAPGRRRGTAAPAAATVSTILPFSLPCNLSRSAGVWMRGQHGLAGHRAVGAAGPGLRIADDGHVRRLDHGAAVAGELPTREWRRRVPPAVGPLLQMHIAQPPLLELPDGPIAGGAELRRIGEARVRSGRSGCTWFPSPARGASASAAAKASSTAAHSFGGLDFVDDVQVDPLGRLLCDDQRNRHPQGETKGHEEGFSLHKLSC